jgi:uncharacterized protein
MERTRITANAPGGRQVIDRYGDGGFRIAGVRHSGSVLVLPDQTLPWPVTAASQVDASSLAPLLQRQPPPRILIVGCGASFEPRPAGLDEALRTAGVGIEWMATGAACRTFNVLVLEDREVAAALIAVE